MSMVIDEPELKGFIGVRVEVLNSKGQKILVTTVPFGMTYVDKSISATVTSIDVKEVYR
jgi:hypothetical protein